ncbi:hypothetical protein PAECIP111893_03434 [Paenibacillus plantiphilus]|uniref:Uncharacterized protein n=1 Tax=Paenibacillus plantiphilus TaxID=2905650 RepID=A0ABN8GKT4_9BACL|nr:hypothetical protein [Paenibacillus plantiphilus]CAH1211583.1 hypothetical protein PAECIP111893_03434 [Paenibacillus plantiphilus]
MIKPFIIAAAVVVLSVGSSAVVAQSTKGEVEPKQHNKPLLAYAPISKQDFIRMEKIIQYVNKGKLPVSALKDAQPLLDRHPEYLHKHIAVQR